MKNYKEIKNCRICKSPRLVQILSFGMQTVIAFPEKPENPEKFNKAPLDLVMCEDCKLIQLRHSFNKDMLYREYWYQSGISPTMVKALRELADKATGLAKLKEDDIVIDIGSNDGTLLSGYPDYVKRVGFEPSNVAKLPEKGKSFLIRDFFNAKSYSSTMTEKAKVITACAMFYDLEDPNTFVHDIKECLDKNGIFIIQMNYLGSMITNKTYDDICMEHDEYYSIAGPGEAIGYARAKDTRCGAQQRERGQHKGVHNAQGKQPSHKRRRPKAAPLEALRGLTEA